MGIIAWVWQTLSWSFWAVLPGKLRPQYLVTAARAGTAQAAEQIRFKRFSSAVRWVLHFVIVILVLVGLYWINQRFDLARVLNARVPGFPDIFYQFWLPLLGLLGYLLCWLVWWLSRLLGPARETADFPDIDEAWGEAMDALF